MSQQIIIESINFEGELAVILFTPLGETEVINLGQVTLPYEFNPSLLDPPKDIYGSYNVLTSGGSCSNILNIVPVTPTLSVTNTQTPTSTPTSNPLHFSSKRNSLFRFVKKKSHVLKYASSSNTFTVNSSWLAKNDP